MKKEPEREVGLMKKMTKTHTHIYIYMKEKMKRANGQRGKWEVNTMKIES